MTFTIDEFVLWAAGLLAAAAIIWRAFTWASDRWQFRKQILEQLTPDGGTSLNDIIRRIDANTRTQHRNLATVYGVILKMHDLDPDDAPLLEVPLPIHSNPPDEG